MSIETYGLFARRINFISLDHDRISSDFYPKTEEILPEKVNWSTAHKINPFKSSRKVFKKKVDSTNHPNHLEYIAFTWGTKVQSRNIFRIIFEFLWLRRPLVR